MDVQFVPGVGVGHAWATSWHPGSFMQVSHSNASHGSIDCTTRGELFIALRGP